MVPLLNRRLQLRATSCSVNKGATPYILADGGNTTLAGWPYGILRFAL